MPNNLNYDVWLIGPGGMGIEYANVLSSLEVKIFNNWEGRKFCIILLHQPIKMFLKGD